MAPAAFAPAPRHKFVFRIFPDERGRWCARTDDGLMGGTFVDRDSALRFARRESVGMPLLLLAAAPAKPSAAEPRPGEQGSRESLWDLYATG